MSGCWGSRHVTVKRSPHFGGASCFHLHISPNKGRRPNPGPTGRWQHEFPVFQEFAPDRAKSACPMTTRSWRVAANPGVPKTFSDVSVNSQPRRRRLRSLEGIVRVFDQAALVPFQLSRPWRRNGIAIQQVVPARSVVPSDVFGGDVVMPGCRQAGGGGQPDKQQAYPNRSRNSHGTIIRLRGLFWNPSGASEP